MLHFCRSYLLVGLFFIGMPNVWAGGDAAAGKASFDKVCAFCHSADGIGKLGPALNGIGQRQNAQWLDNWLLDPRGMMKTDDYAKALKAENKYNMTMPSIPAMKDDAKRSDVIAYLLETF